MKPERLRRSWNTLPELLLYVGLVAGLSAVSMPSALADITISAVDQALVRGIPPNEPDGPDVRTIRLSGFSVPPSGSNRWLILVFAANAPNSPDNIVQASARFNTQEMTRITEHTEAAGVFANAYSAIFALRDPASTGDMEVVLDFGENRSGDWMSIQAFVASGVSAVEPLTPSGGMFPDRQPFTLELPATVPKPGTVIVGSLSLSAVLTSFSVPEPPQERLTVAIEKSQPGHLVDILKTTAAEDSRILWNKVNDGHISALYSITGVLLIPAP